MRTAKAWGRRSAFHSVQAAFYPFPLRPCFLATNVQQYRRKGYGMGYGRPTHRGVGQRWGVSPLFRGPCESCVTCEARYRDGLRWTIALPRGDGRLSRTRQEAVRIVGRVNVATRDDTVMSHRGGGVSGRGSGRFDLYFPEFCTPRSRCLCSRSMRPSCGLLWRRSREIVRRERSCFGGT